MRRTVAATVRVKAPKADEFQKWAAEIGPAVKELQDRFNGEYFGRFSHATTFTGAFETAWTSDSLPNDGAWRVYVEVQARATDGSTAYYEIQSIWKRVAGGVATQVGSTAAVTPSAEDVAAWDVQFVAATNGVAVQVRGDGTRTISWALTPYITELV